jgi:hypothetical protein
MWPARLAVVVGDLSKSDPYVVRVKVPAHVKLMPHRHHEDRVYTVMSGVFYIGVGDSSTTGSWRPTRRGPSSFCPAVPLTSTGRKSGEYVTQVRAIGPISLDYVDPADDPRRALGTSG